MEPVTAQSSSGQISVELSSRRTGLSFQRTRMSADRTLMSVIRTSLSLIGFGFTIFQFFKKMQEADVLQRAQAPRNFGVALVLLGVGMLAVAIVYHIHFMLGLRDERKQLIADGLLHGRGGFPISFTLIIALMLLTIGLGTILSMTLHIGPFS